MSNVVTSKRRYPDGTWISPRAIDKDTYVFNFVSATGERLAEQHLDFQIGPISEYGVNGIQTEHVLDVLIHRTKKLNQLLPCPENVNAIASMESARVWLAERTRKRTEQGVEGKDLPHESSVPVANNEPHSG